MSSGRCNVGFQDADGDVVACIYLHFNGYPDVVLPGLDRFFAAVETQSPDNSRFGDPSYLAARYVVWQAGRHAPPGRPLDFHGVGIAEWGTAYAYYEYIVRCADRSARPVVTIAKGGDHD